MPIAKFWSKRPQIVIVGAGPGGLAAAALLARAGADVRVLERDNVVGGRTRILEGAGGYRFDSGPTFFLYPQVLREIFAACGADLDQRVTMKRLDPQYRLVFEDGGHIDATPDPQRMAAELAKINPADGRNFESFLRENRRKLAAFQPILQRPFDGIGDLLRPDMLRALPLLHPLRSVHSDLARYFKDPRVRLAFSFQSKYLGMSPFRCPSLFTILSFLEYEHGVFHPLGGCGAVTSALADLAQEQGAHIELGTPVERIEMKDGRVREVVTATGSRPADAVVVNADFAHAIPGLLAEEQRRGWSDRKIERARYSCSTFMLYLGLDRQFPALPHHTIALSSAYKENIREIERGQLPTQPSFYLQNPVVTDPSLAPAGGSSLYLLVPMPHLQPRHDWASLASQVRRQALDRLKLIGLPDIEPHIRYERMVTPQHWQDDFAVYRGATFNLAHDFGQMLLFRPKNRFSRAGVYLVGGGTHPGSGLPVIFESARISCTLLAQDYGLSIPEPQTQRPISVLPAAAVTRKTELGGLGT
jgi:phytoene desaturase